MKETITFSQVKSYIGSPQDVRATLIGLGLTKMHKTITRKRSPELLGMLAKVNHLIKIKE